jgi:CRISPR-associated protein Cmr3
MLYSARHLRFQDGIVPDGHYHRASLIVVVDKLEAEDFPQKVFNIGGEKRLACFMPVDDCFSSFRNMKEVVNKIKKRRQFFVYLVTPAIFDGGWQPKKWPAEFDGAELVGAAVNKPLYISGWQRSGKGMAGSPRELKRAVPAGSVYFFKMENWDDQCFEALYTKYNFGESISSYYPDAGFGTIFIGAW